MRINLSKNEKYLLGLTMVFFCILALLLARDGGQASSYVISTQRTAQEALAPASALLDLNSATDQELMELPGVGAVLAQRILDWRAAHGPFTEIDQLLEVKGIGEAKLAGIKDNVCIGGAS